MTTEETISSIHDLLSKWILFPQMSRDDNTENKSCLKHQPVLFKSQAVICEHRLWMHATAVRVFREVYGAGLSLIYSKNTCPCASLRRYCAIPIPPW